MDLFDLVAKITLDSSEYERNLNDASDKTSTFGDKVKNGFSTAGKVAAAGIAAAGTAAVALGKESLEAYADYEQLVGGVETLFKDSSGTVQEYAANAYKTAGLSANEYMETVTSFSASLLQSLDGDTQAAADYADMAITDMSDNANKMGTSMESIQNAYQGFAKQNYTMLDNLKLGYGGTKEEMERLIEDAEELDSSFKAARDENGNLTMSYADIVSAIHVVQDEMGITGTTSTEASSTISGSVASMRSSWQNLLVGVADDNADFETLVENFIDSVVTVGENIIPRVESILNGLGELITQAADKLIPIVVETIINNLPKIVESGIKLIVTLISGLISAIPQLVKAIPQIVVAIVKGFVSAWPQLKQAGVELINMLVEGLESAFQWLVGIGEQVIAKIAEGISNAWQNLTSWFNNLWNGLFSNRNVDVNVNGNAQVNGSHAIGLDFVPYSGYLAELHRGEAVLTSREADEWRRGGGNQPQESNQPITIVVQSMLDGKVVGESVTRYQRNMARATG